MSFTAMSRFSLSGSALPSNMWLLKRFGSPLPAVSLVSSTRGMTSLSSLSALAVVRVQSDVDRIPFCRTMHVFGDRDRAKRPCPSPMDPDAKAPPPVADLDNTVTLALGQSLEHGICGRERCYVDSGIGIASSAPFQASHS